MSTIVVLRNLLDGDEAAAQAAHRRFEEAYSQSLGAVTPIPAASTRSPPFVWRASESAS